MHTRRKAQAVFNKGRDVLYIRHRLAVFTAPPPSQTDLPQYQSLLRATQSRFNPAPKAHETK